MIGVRAKFSIATSDHPARALLFTALLAIDCAGNRRKQSFDLRRRRPSSGGAKSYKVNWTKLSSAGQIANLSAPDWADLLSVDQAVPEFCHNRTVQRVI
jgi:hypothetical protein